MNDKYDTLVLVKDTLVEPVLSDGHITPPVIGAPLIAYSTAEKISKAKEDAESAKSASERNLAVASGTIAGGMGGAAIASSLVFPPAIPLVALGAWIGFNFSSGK